MSNLLPPPEIISWSEKYDIPPEILMDRVTHGWDLFAAFVVPIGEKVNLEFIGLNSKAYHSALWSELPVTTRQLVQHYRPEYDALYYLSNPTGEYMPYLLSEHN